MTNALGGLLITLHDKETLDLYLTEQIYGFLLSPPMARSSTVRTYYRILADYSCVRTGTHVFFVYKRQIVYGGQITGNALFASFYLNGDASPLGKEANAQLFWDESERYVRTARPGIFRVGEKQKCQPAVLVFKAKPGMRRRRISLEDYYFRLAIYPYLLPSMVTQDQGIWTLNPAETQVALDLLSASPDELEPLNIRHKVIRGENPTLFNGRLGIQDLQSAYDGNQILSREHLQFSVTSNPHLLPREIRPSTSVVICRQVPFSPPKPYQIDRASICFYDRDEMMGGGSLPNRILEVRERRANEEDLDLVERCLMWLQRIADPNTFRRIRACLCAPSFSESALAFPSKFGGQIILTEFSGKTRSLVG